MEAVGHRPAHRVGHAAGTFAEGGDRACRDAISRIGGPGHCDAIAHRGLRAAAPYAPAHIGIWPGRWH